MITINTLGTLIASNKKTKQCQVPKSENIPIFFKYAYISLVLTFLSTLSGLESWLPISKL